MTRWFEVRDADGRAIFRVEANFKTKELCFAPSEAWCAVGARLAVTDCMAAATEYLDAAKDAGTETVVFEVKE